MYKALIIDDEQDAIEDVYSAFNWRSLRVTEIIKINKTRDLVKLIVSEQPHIVFIDIEMGSVLGLHIVEECKRLMPDIIFIIVSGHDDFAYAQTSIRLSVTYYLLKPFTEYDVDIASEKIMDQLNTRFGSQTGVTLNSINSFLSNKSQFQEFLLEDGVSFPNTYYFFVVRMFESNVDIKHCLQERLIRRYKIGQNKFMFLVEAPLERKHLILLENAIQTNPMTIGISEPFENPEAMYGCFKQANMLAHGDFLGDGKNIYRAEKSDEGKFDEYMDSIQMFLDSKMFSKLKSILKILPDEAKKGKFSLEELVYFYNSFVVKVNELLRRNKMKDYLNVLSFEELVDEYSNVQNMCESLSMSLKAMEQNYMEVGAGFDEEANVDVVNLVISYLQKNYSQKIGIKDLGRIFYISAPYLCEIFKTVTQKTILEYLTEIRIEAAKELLLSSQMSITRVAELTGYGDYCYFNKIFKKYTGETPYQYRKKGNVEHED